MKTALKILLTILLSLIFGILSIYATLKIGARNLQVKNGPWRTDPLIGSRDAGLYTRLLISLGGTLALNKSEAIYYTADTDDEGNPLKTRCSYRISGGSLASRWWSITLYGEDMYLVKNDPERYSYNPKTLKWDKDGKYAIYLSQKEKSGNWLPTGEGDSFNLLLRLYRPKPEVLEKLHSIELPKIIRENCK